MKSINCGLVSAVISIGGLFSSSAFAQSEPADVDLDSFWGASLNLCVQMSSYCVAAASSWVSFTAEFGLSPDGIDADRCCGAGEMTREFASIPYRIKKRYAGVTNPLCPTQVFGDFDVIVWWGSPSYTFPATPACKCRRTRIYIPATTVQVRETDLYNCFSLLAGPQKIYRHWVRIGPTAYFRSYLYDAACVGCPQTKTNPDGTVTNLPAPGTLPTGEPSFAPDTEVVIPMQQPDPSNSTPNLFGYNKLDFDLCAVFKGRNVASQGEMNLYELRLCVSQLAEALADPDGSAAPTNVTIMINDRVTLSGGLSALKTSLIKHGKQLVASKDFGDFNQDGQRDHLDVGLLQAAVLSPEPTDQTVHTYDLDGDNALTANDLSWWQYYSQR